MLNPGLESRRRFGARIVKAIHARRPGKKRLHTAGFAILPKLTTAATNAQKRLLPAIVYRKQGHFAESTKISMRMQHHATLKTYGSRFQVVGLSYYFDEIAASCVT